MIQSFASTKDKEKKPAFQKRCFFEHPVYCRDEQNTIPTDLKYEYSIEVAIKPSWSEPRYQMPRTLRLWIWRRSARWLFDGWLLEWRPNKIRTTLETRQWTTFQTYFTKLTVGQTEERRTSGFGTVNTTSTDMRMNIQTLWKWVRLDYEVLPEHELSEKRREDGVEIGHSGKTGYIPFCSTSLMAWERHGSK